LIATAPAPPTDIDVLVGRLPVATADLAGLTGDWHLWPSWATSTMAPALVRHLDGTPGIPTARFAAVIPFIYTSAIVVGRVVDAEYGYDDRWCYHTRTAALAAAHVWDGQGEPVGWHRHPGTDRRTINGDMTRIFTDETGCSQCGARLFQHECVHKTPCCPGTCPGVT
jgi:hypothetical protein